MNNKEILVIVYKYNTYLGSIDQEISNGRYARNIRANALRKRRKFNSFVLRF